MALNATWRAGGQVQYIGCQKHTVLTICQSKHYSLQLLIGTQEAPVPLCSLADTTQKLLKGAGLVQCKIYWSIPHKCQVTFAPYIFQRV